MSYFENLPKKSQKRYKERTTITNNVISKLLNDNPLSFEPFNNIPIMSSLFKSKIAFSHTRDIDTYYGDMVLSTFDTFLISLIENYKETYNKTLLIEDLYDYETNTKNIITILENFSNIDYGDYVKNETGQFEYLLVGNENIHHVFELIKRVSEFGYNGHNVSNSNNERYYFGDYKNIKIYNIPNLKNDIYLLNGPIMNMSSLNVAYHDTYDNIVEDKSNFDSHKVVLDYNSPLGTCDMVKIKVISGEEEVKMYNRRNKLESIMKKL